MDAASIEKYEQRILRRERSYRRTKWAAIGVGVLLLVLTIGMFVMVRVFEARMPANISPEVRADIAQMHEEEGMVCLGMIPSLAFAFLAWFYGHARVQHAESIRFHREAAAGQSV